jgi:asparagine synthase (glutamine-hydrolysing)
LLDHRLVERLFTLPGSMKLARGVNKPLLAEAVPELPKATSRRKKMGFTLPLAAWLRGPLREWAEDRLPGASALGLDAAAVTQVWRGFLDGRAPFSHVWTLIALADWCRREGVSA